MSEQFSENSLYISLFHGLYGPLSLRQFTVTDVRIRPFYRQKPVKTWRIRSLSFIDNRINPKSFCSPVCGPGAKGSAMPRVVYKKLTAITVRKLQKPGLHADGNGLYLRITKTGSKSWVMRYQDHGKPKTIGLGSAVKIPLAEARETVERLQKAKRDGADPVAERDGRAAGMTFDDAARSYIAETSPSWKNAKHAQQWANTIATYATPMVGDRPVADVDSNDIWKVLSPIWQEKPETARRVKQRMHAILEWAHATGHRKEQNPVDTIRRVLPKQQEAKSHHAALPYQQMPVFLADLRSSNSNRFIRLGLEFLVRTASRTSEVLGARWEEIDGDIWTVPASRMKTGREHRVPLTEATAALLEQVRKVGVRSDFIFPGRDWNRPLSGMAFLMAIRRIGYGEFTVHGFRSTFRDWTAERTNVQRDVCEAALAHSVGNKVEAAYKRTDLFDKRRSLMDGWCAFLDEKEGNVVKLRA